MTENIDRIKIIVLSLLAIVIFACIGYLLLSNNKESKYAKNGVYVEYESNSGRYHGKTV